MFATTRWSLVAAAADPAAPEARAALADLCRAYWFPVYAYVRRRGADHHAGQDLTQAFFARLLEMNDLAAADRTRGRFRAFLLAACQHFLANEHDKRSAKKRGGGRHHVSLDFADADGRYGREPAAPDDSAERAFERRWAVELLDQTVGELRAEYAAGGKAVLFDALKGCLLGGAPAYADLAAELGLTEGAVKVAVHRLRQRYRDRLRDVIGRTVADPADIDDEIRDLFAAVG